MLAELDAKAGHFRSGCRSVATGEHRASLRVATLSEEIPCPLPVLPVTPPGIAALVKAPARLTTPASVLQPVNLRAASARVQVYALPVEAEVLSSHNSAVSDTRCLEQLKKRH